MAKELTKQSDVFGLPGPRAPKTEVLYFDRGKAKDRAKGLALRVRPDQSRTWLFFYRFGGSQKRLTIGAASNDQSGWTFDKARVRARSYRVAVDDNRDPRAERDAIRAEARAAEGAKTLGETVEAYLIARQPEMKPRSHSEVARHLRTQWKPLHKHRLHDITADMVADRLKVIGNTSGPVARNRARSSLSAMYAWAIIERFSEPRPVNPVADTGKVAESGGRERVLSDTELAAIWIACPATGYGRIVRLLMLTAQRREEIGGLRWQEIDSPDAQGKALIALPGERTKNGRAHDVPLSTLALEVLEEQPRMAGRDLVFGEGEGGYSGWSRSKAALDEACGVSGWTLHDLRRTAATRMADLGVQPHVIEAILNHISGHKAGVAGIYNRSTYAAEKRSALDLWANHIRTIVAQASGANVQRMKRSAG